MMGNFPEFQPVISQTRPVPPSVFIVSFHMHMPCTLLERMLLVGTT